MGHWYRQLDGTSAASSMHFEMWVFTKFFNTDEPPDTQSVTFKGFALFCASVAAAFPAGTEQGPQLVGRCTGTERRSEVCTCGGVQTAIPHTVGGHPATIAGGAEWCGRRRNNPEDRSIRQKISLSWCSSPLRYRLDYPIVPAQQSKHLSSGKHLLLRPIIRTPDVHILDESNLCLYLFGELDQCYQFIIIEPSNRHRIEF